MMITYTLSEEDIKLAIKDYCRKFTKSDETFILTSINLQCDIDDRNLIKIFSATATPTKINPQR